MRSALSLTLVFVEANVASAGGTWSAPTNIDSHSPLSVSCPSASFCVAVDNNGNAIKYNGSPWSAVSDIDTVQNVSSVSCPSASFCVAVDDSGNALTYNGSSWSSPSAIDRSNGLDSVSCPSTSFCVAVDEKGNALTYNGSAWSAPSAIDGSSVSCASASFCVAVNGSGSVFTYNGSSWSSPSDINGRSAFLSVSCPSASFCATVAAGGNAFTYTPNDVPTPTVSSVSPNTGSVSGGTAITITGTGFVAGATVTIGQGSGPVTGAIAASDVNVVSPTEITATTGGGAQAGTWSLFVDTSGGTSAAVGADDFTYTAAPVIPTVSAVSPDTGPTSGGTAITVTGTGFISGATVGIGEGSGPFTGAIAASNVKVVSPTEITATTGGGATAGTWSLYVTTSGGTSAANLGDDFTYS